VATDREDAADARIAALAQELASAINRSAAAGRIEQRDLAIDVLRDAVETGAADADEGTDLAAALDTATAANPFALGIPVSMAGLALSFIFPPVGVLLLLVGMLVCGFGLVLAIGRSLMARFRA